MKELFNEIQQLTDKLVKDSKELTAQTENLNNKIFGLSGGKKEGEIADSGLNGIDIKDNSVYTVTQEELLNNLDCNLQETENEIQ